MSDLLPNGITKEIGHFNVFDVAEDADKTIEIEQHALIFATPKVPYNWVPLWPVQGGYFCLFTADFLAQSKSGVVLDELLYSSRALQLRTAKDYADQLSIHVNYLNRVLKEQTGQTTKNHLVAGSPRKRKFCSNKPTGTSPKSHSASASEKWRTFPSFSRNRPPTLPSLSQLGFFFANIVLIFARPQQRRLRSYTKSLRVQLKHTNVKVFELGEDGG